MGKKSLFRSTSKKKKKIGLGTPGHKSVAKSEKKAVTAAKVEKKITAKAANHENQPETDLSKMAIAIKPEDKLTAAETGATVESSAEKTDTGAPVKTGCQPETAETHNDEPLANPKGENQTIETGVIEPDAIGPEKMMDTIKKNTAANETSKINAKNESEPAYLTNTETIDKKNNLPQPVPDRPEPSKHESSKVVINYGSEVEMETSTAAKKGIIISVAAILFIYALIISASVINTHNYYVKTTFTAVEVWQGCFAPLGEELLITIPDVQPPSPVKDVYTRAEIFKFIFDHFLKAADAVIDLPGMPDVKKMDTLLTLALQYADTDQQRKAADRRLNGLKQLFLLYKADIAIFKGTSPDLQIAAEYLNKALPLAADNNQEARIQRQLETVRSLTAELEQSLNNVIKNEKTPADQAKPTDPSPEKNEPEKTEKTDQVPVESDTTEEKKEPADSATLKDEKQVHSEPNSDKQTGDTKTDAKAEN